MAADRHDPTPAAREQLVEGRRRARDAGPDAAAATAPAPALDPRASALAALQRSAGNAAVSALLAGRLRSFGRDEVVEKIDTALREIRDDEPDVAKVEPGLRAAKDLGVPVDLDGYERKPPASALNVVKTGFGPGAVPGKKPVPPPKRTPSKSPLAAASRPVRKAAGPPGHAPAAPSSSAGPGPVAAAEPDLLAPPTPPSRTRPEDDPGFTGVTAAVKAHGREKKAHPPAAAKAKEAQDAAVPPSGDLDGQAKAAKVDTMDAQRAGGFDKKAFIAAVKSAIEAKSPKNLEEADDYAESGKAGEVKDEVKGLVGGDKKASAQDIETAAAAPPDPSKADPKQVTPMPAEQPGQPRTIPASTAVPKVAPPDQLNLAAGKHQVNQEMADADVTDQQLAESHEPEFEGAVAAKQEAAQHADTAPGAFRAEEKATIAQAKTEANQQSAATTTGMHGSKLAALAKVVAGKATAKSKDEARRAEVTTKVQGIYAATEIAVKQILDGIDPKVDNEFKAGEKAARAAFERYVSAKMSAFKKDRYGGWLGGFRWAKDKLVGMPDKVNEFYEAGRELYLKEMDRVITKVADIVAIDLTAAKNRIAAGKTEIATYVKSLPRDLQKVGANASKEIGDQFQQLESDVNDKQDALVDTLASKYIEARKGLDDRIEELQAENKGLVDKVIGAIKAVVNTIRKLAAMLRDVFVKAAGVVGEIIKSPARFLGNLVDGVKGGITRFKDNILTHLREGLMAWLFGSVAKGVELPDSFDVRGVVKLLASIFGLTPANIRKRLVRAVGERAVGLLEKSGDVFPLLLTEGPAGIWHRIVKEVGDVKDMIVEKAKSFIVNRIIHAGIEFLISLLNPVAAFIKACKLIYDIVMFFVENIDRIARFVNTVLDSVGDVARGAVGAVSEKVESALAQMVPILIGFFARVLNIGGIGEKIREIVAALQKPVTKALDGIIATGLKLAGPIIRGIKGISGKVNAKAAAGKAYMKGKVEAGKQWAKGKAEALREALSFRRSFEVNGEKHSLYTVDDSSRLVVASTPTDLDKHPDKAVRAAYAAYRADVDSAKTHPQKKTAAAKRLPGILAALHKWFKKSKKKGDDPRASAPGIGNIAPNRNQPSSLRGDVAVWALESEHVIPRGFSNAAFVALRLEGIPEGSPDYEAQHTVMIYKGAANIKTHPAEADNAMTRELKKNLSEILAEYRKAKPSARAKLSQIIVDVVFNLLSEYAEDSVERTWIAVDKENKKNRARRGPPGVPEKLIPNRGRIREAAVEQMSDIMKQLRARLTRIRE